MKKFNTNWILEKNGEKPSERRDSEDVSLDTLNAKGLMIVAHTKFNNRGVRKRTGESLVRENRFRKCVPREGGGTIITYFKCKRFNGCNPVVIQGNLLQALQALECLKLDKCT
jgi:hypothetical protein